MAFLLCTWGNDGTRTSPRTSLFKLNHMVRICQIPTKIPSIINRLHHIHGQPIIVLPSAGMGILPCNNQSSRGNLSGNLGPGNYRFPRIPRWIPPLWIPVWFAVLECRSLANLFANLEVILRLFAFTTFLTSRLAILAAHLVWLRFAGYQLP